MHMNINFDNVIERDMDMLLMRQFAIRNDAFLDLFFERAGIKQIEIRDISISHSVMTDDGETDVEAILNVENKRIAFLIEDKISAIAQPDQAARYEERAMKDIEQGRFDEYYIFIVAPKKYLDNNEEAHKYPHLISYEQIKETLKDSFDIAIIAQALYESKRGYVSRENKQVTLFWDRMYDFVEEKFPDTFSFYGKKGDIHASNWWISIKSGQGTRIVIKSDRGFVDLEIAGYTERFQEFSRANQELLDRKQLHLRMASKSLAIRKYVDVIDFTKDFDEQIPKVEYAFIKAKELLNVAKELKI